jgi:cell division protein FtsW
VPRTAVKRQDPRLNIDVPLVLILLTLIGFGLLMMNSASWNASMMISKRELGTSSPTYLFMRQLRWLGLGIASLIFFTWLNYHYWRYLSIAAMAITVIALSAVLVIGETYDGITRSFHEGSYQPSELAKFVIVIYLAVWLYAKRDQLSSLSFGLLPLGAIVGIVSGLIMRQPDLSAAGMVMILGGLMYYLAGSDARQTFGLVLVAGLAGYFVLRFNPMGIHRVDTFLQGWEDVLASSDHLSAAAGLEWESVTALRS